MPPKVRDPWDPDGSDEEDQDDHGLRDPARTGAVGQERRSCSRSRSPVPAGSSSASVSTGAAPCDVGFPATPHMWQKSLPTPQFAAGTEWWANVIWAFFESERAARPQYQVEFRHESFCTGSMMEAFGAQAMDLGWSTLSCAEEKKFARQFVLRNHKEKMKLKHVLSDFRAQIIPDIKRQCDVCSLSGGECSFEFQRPHLAVGGLPCQPFSPMRHKTGSSSNQKGAQQHSKYDTVF
eukprot:570328-Lingulodinium_polyedra.AAC.1